MNGNRQISESRATLLVLRAQSGDREAMDQLLQLHQGELFGYLARMLNHHSDAEDALQSSLLQAARKIRWLREPKLFRPWIFRIASRIAYRQMSKRGRRREISNVEFIDESHIAEEGDRHSEEWIEKIPEWLEHLSPKGREALMLHYLQGFKTEQVAEILGIPYGTAKSRISHALSCIRRQIEIGKEHDDK